MNRLRKIPDRTNELPLLPVILPSVLFAERQKLPQASGIYFALGKRGEVLYVGKSKNIHQRWMAHHKHKDLNTLDCQSISYYACSLGEITLIERSMILQFGPPLNGRGLPRVIKTKAGVEQKKRVTVPCWMNQESRILTVLLRDGPLLAKDIVDSTGMSYNQVFQVLQQLVAERYVHRSGPKRRFRFDIAGRPDAITISHTRQH